MNCSHCKQPVSADAGPRAVVMHAACSRAAHRAAVRRLGLAPFDRAPAAAPEPAAEPTLYRVVGLHADGTRRVIGTSLGIDAVPSRVAQGESGAHYARHRFARVVVEEDV